jgi:uncharacterized protein (TIGR03086 family)
MSPDPLSALSLALDCMGGLVAAVEADQWSGPTPCTEWSVADLVRHFVDGNYRFATAVDGLERTPVTETEPSDLDLPGAYRDSASALAAAFAAPGVLERIVTIPIGSLPGVAVLHVRVTELLTHGWDLAVATGQPVRFPDDLVEAEIAFSRAKLDEIPPERRAFAPSRPVVADAPAIERLVALLGRDVTGQRQTQG